MGVRPRFVKDNGREIGGRPRFCIAMATIDKIIARAQVGHPDNQHIVRIRKGITLGEHKFDISDRDDRPIGYFYRKTSFHKRPEQLDFCIARGAVQ